MFEFHYNVIKRYFKDRVHIIYGDTDSLVYLVRTEDFYAEVSANPDLLKWFDTSNLPHNHPAYSIAKKKIPGLFSDETNGLTIYEFISLRPKTYAFEKESVDAQRTDEKIKAKGIKGHVVKHHLTMEDFKTCLFLEEEAYRENISIRSFQHDIKTIKTMKMTLNWHDDKRFILPDRIHTLAHGHYKLTEQQPGSDDEEMNETR
ncbi:uncharacterized protein LOC126845392 [Adelges cooleyi]|uniref:uncharacterized protein LOC126842613 n=1 Tax=Adelges cooleyi TaxID=133065 RepID=UPI00218058A3|nr:uncharacterized protein LOC126842613 [Adelges cooleyi]XP_050440002.1 uncharacterized protein LOC126845391 [Adelges cooleyi]XP_050440003.1 uncharacterized protein LOC126845392 [Adelges cooleyi]